MRHDDDGEMIVYTSKKGSKGEIAHSDRGTEDHMKYTIR